MSLFAMAPVVTFPCNPRGFQVVDYQSRSRAAKQAASRRLLLPLPVDAASNTSFAAPCSLVEELDALSGDRHAALPSFQPGTGLLQLRRNRACIQRMHGELQPTSMVVQRQLPSCDIIKSLAAPAELAVCRLPPEAYIAMRQPVCSVLPQPVTRPTSCRCSYSRCAVSAIPQRGVL